MTKKIFGVAAICVLAMLGGQNSSYAQAVSPGQESSVAILDTGVLFAIGAREAEQQIRGAFGWPTFQEGFVDGVYFRFDPDGYARFSTSPRLDENVFEVTCVPGSPICAAKKDSIEIGLTSEGQVQIRLSGITPADTFFISDKKSELPLPPTVLEPLDARLETLLASAGDLIVKRELEPIQSISLSGFSAAATFLRWVAQGQSPRVFPRGWPVPAQSDQQVQAGLTQASQWVSPNPAPQAVQTTWQAQRGGIPAFGAAPQTVSGAFNSQIETNDFSNQGTFGAQAQQNASPQVTQMQLEMQALQAQLAQLRSGASQTGQSANGLQQGWDQNSGTFNSESGQSFAGQAQGRSLPTPAGFPNDAYQQEPTSFDQGLSARNTQAGFGAPQDTYETRGNHTQPNQIAQLYQRIGQLELAVQKMSFDLSRQISALSFALKTAPTQAQPDVSGTYGLRNQGGVPQVQEGVANSRQLSELETLMMMRLNQNKQMADEPAQAPLGAANTTVANTNVSLDRNVVEELLRSMEQGTEPLQKNPETQTTLDSETIPTPSADGSATEPTEEFISLSDYINKVLKSEGVSTGAQ